MHVHVELRKENRKIDDRWTLCQSLLSIIISMRDNEFSYLPLWLLLRGFQIFVTTLRNRRLALNHWGCCCSSPGSVHPSWRWKQFRDQRWCGKINLLLMLGLISSFYRRGANFQKGLQIGQCSTPTTQKVWLHILLGDLLGTFSGILYSWIEV